MTYKGRVTNCPPPNTNKKEIMMTKKQMLRWLTSAMEKDSDEYNEQLNYLRKKYKKKSKK